MSTIKNLFTFQCPCCQERINAIKIVHPTVNNGCKTKTEYKCFYCPKCDRKIGKANSVKRNSIVQVSLVLMIIFIVNQVCSYFNLSMYINILLYIFIFYFSLVVFVKTYPFECYQEDDNIIKRDNVMTEFYAYDNVRMDSTEEKISKIIYLLPLLFIITIAILLFVQLLS